MGLQVGPRLRAARQAAGMSLRALAEKTGFSASFLSQVELAQSSPSLASLQRICAALDIELPELLREPSRAAKTPVMRRRERESLRSEWSKAVAESLLPSNRDDRFTALLVALDRGGRTGPMRPRAGAQQFAYCLRGRVSVVIGGEETYELSRGDSIVLEHDRALAWENVGTGPAEVMLVTARLA